MPGAIAAAEMHADAEIGQVPDHTVGDRDVAVDQRIRVVAARLQARTHLASPNLANAVSSICT